MSANRWRIQTIISGLLATTALTAAAGAQPTESDIPRVFREVDENGVDQISGMLVTSMASISIGPGGPGSLTYDWGSSNSARTELFGFVYANTPSAGKYSVTIGSATETFTLSGGTYTQDQGRGSTLTYDAGTARFTYTRTDGAVAIFDNMGGAAPPSISYIRSLTYPAGQSLTYYHRSMPPIPPNPYTYFYVRSVISNLGYQLHYDYTPTGTGTYRLSRVVLFNRANEACDPDAETCTLSGNWPSLTFTEPVTNEVDATDNLGRLYRWVGNAATGNTTLIFPTGRTLTYTGGFNNRVASVNDGRGTWQYSYPNPNGGTTLTFYPEQNGPPRQVIFDNTNGHILQEVNRQVQTLYTWTSNRISSVQVQGGATTQYTYDSRGNATQVRQISATPGAPPDIVTGAVYPATCANPKTCNQPTSTTDALGRTTDYTYDPNSGAVLSVQLPAGANGIRPQTLYGYAAYQAYYLNGTGSIAASGSNVTLPVSVSSCMTGAPGSCAGTADEARTTIAYGPQTPGVANNLLPVSTTAGNGNATLSATTATTYTSNGDVETVDGPLAGSADNTRTYYDAARRPTGTIGADPDGGGALLRRATRTTYNGDDQPTTVETGTATDQSASGMATFTSLRQRVTAYDAQGRATSVRLNAGGTTYALSQSSTTVSGLPDCSALRMNTATFASPPASACDATTEGGDGPDRINRIGYDWYRRLPVTVTTGLHTNVEAVDVTTTYDAVNRVATVADGNGNLTTFEYDGLGRRTKTRYPSPSTPGQSSTTDYEQPTFDAAGNVTSLRLRDGTNIGYTYDNLNRLVLKHPPSSEPDVSYTYDMLNRVTGASIPGHTLSFTYDALGRNLSQTSPLGAVSYGYDLAGHRTSMTYPGSTTLVVGYTYDAAGELTEIHENPAGLDLILASYAYDNLGRRIALSRVDGTSTSYSYDNVSRLSQQVENLSGTSYDQTATFSYNPANEITSTSRSNDAFAWTGHYNVNRPYTSNGLNQYTASGSIIPSYDSRGNLTSGGGTPFYVYDSQNLLTSSWGQGTLSYDPLARLFQTSGAATTRMFYDGQNLIAEYDGSNALQRRYVFGPGTDEPLVWYDGSDLSTRRFFHADERGSVVAITDLTGAVVSVNTYDEHGIPGATNAGRFQYTGQEWLPDIGMYYYRARMYSPTLGRFMQTDPIGYEAGMNLYNYVRGDPINFVDPLGLRQICWHVDNTHWQQGGSVPTIVVESRRVCFEIADWAMDQVGPPIPWDGQVPPPTNRISFDGLRACGEVPPAPPGVSIDNILRAGVGYGGQLNFINRIGFMAHNFPNRSGMDFKQINAHPGSQSPFEHFGNFAYGAFTYEFSIPEAIATSAAGIAQIRSGNARLRDVLTDFDDPNDQADIIRGRQFAACMLP